MARATVAACVLIIGTSLCRADTHYVATNGYHNWPYTNWHDAAVSIQPAIDAASGGDAVVVSNGTYYITACIAVTQGVTVTSLNGTTDTIVDGCNSNRCFYVCASNAAIDGFTIQNGDSDYGVLDPLMGAGGGVYCLTGTVRRCLLTKNRAWGGGGVYCHTGGRVEDCAIVDNYGGISGGGVVVHGGTILRCRIMRNWALNGGGARAFYGCLIGNSTIAENMGGGPSGILLQDTSVVHNCTITANLVTYDDECGGISCHSGGIVRNSIIYGNEGVNWQTFTNIWPTNVASYAYTCTTPLPPGTGNITNDPQLTPSYRLKSTSPCIDAGTASNAPLTDIDGEARWDHPWHSNGLWIVDIGADEFVDTDLDHLADCWETNWFGSVTNRDGTADGDADDLDDRGEYENSTDPGDRDTDGDRMPDGWELGNSLDPLADDADGNADSDGMDNLGEYAADTNPQDDQSFLAITGILSTNGGVSVWWQGGVWATQYLECRESLLDVKGPWLTVFTNPPPTTVTTNVLDMGATDEVLFYRIRAERP